ncbi:anti-sigma factor [Neoaquamicrobium sediminum]|uniref:Regulator of SigK n=1 Tax=Neoaquamicrobium sediminum TaxID=1849104 RepID=A0ABV3WVL0_9HYPH
MTPADDRDLEHGGDDALAAEYVLGVLPGDERQAVARRVEEDAAFASLVGAWEERLSPLNAGYEDVEPPASLKTLVDARLFERPDRKPEPRPGFFESLAFWRGLAGAAVAALAIAIALPFLQPAAVPEVAPRLVASLADDGTDVRYLAVYDGHSGDIGLSHVTGDRAQGRDFELWLIEGDAAPVSLGVVPVGASVHVPVAPAHRQMIASGALFAISLEPEGGSPTGQPTGPVVAAGDLRSI